MAVAGLIPVLNSTQESRSRHAWLILDGGGGGGGRVLNSIVDQYSRKQITSRLTDCRWGEGKEVGRGVANSSVD